MTLRRISLVFLGFSLVASIWGLMVLGFHIPWKISLSPFITLSSFIFAVLHAGQREGWSKAALLVGFSFTIGLLFESLGVITGWVYGPYHYTDLLGPKVFDLVPFFIPMAWFMMIYPSYLIARALVPGTWGATRRGLAIAALSALIMTAWDVAMDPMMVYGGFWVWEVKGAYFGVPLQNFFGWWLTTFTAVGLYVWTTRKMLVKTAAIPERWAIAVYWITGGTSIATCLIIPELRGVGLAGLFSMLPWMVIGWFVTGRNKIS